MINWLHTFHPQAILIQIGFLKIHWYGFLMVVGGLIGYWIALKLAPRFKITEKVVTDILIWFSVGAVIGARIYYVIYNWSYYGKNVFDIIKIWNGGLAVHGVMIGGFLAVLLYCKLKKLNFWLIADLGATALVAGQIIGRWGNYFNQEIFGKPTNLPWGIPIDIVDRPIGFEQSNYFHPTFLYEVLGNVIILIILLTLHIIRIKKNQWNTGNIFLIYLALYSMLRFSLEFVRIDYSPLVFGIRWAMVMSVVLWISSVAMLLARGRKNLRTQELR